MNYRHSYHAGNFADVLKHAVLALVLEYMKRKEAPFRVIDTHAGAGRYALTSAEAEKTGEWQGGIARLTGPGAKPLPAAVARYLQPYLDVVRGENAGDTLGVYPGSPALALGLMRPQDTLIANELHPQERALLEDAIGADRRAKVMALDAWVALKALLPPKERRGVVLIDPPFEEKDELDRMAAGLAQGLQRFATGVYVAWYPIKDVKPIARFHTAVAALATPGSLPVKSLRIELMIQRATDPDRLNGCGLIVINPPYALEEELAAILPELSRRLASPEGGASYRLERLDSARAGTVPEPKRRMRQVTRIKR
jgi:23S rRNA (adenine2030-N6)-methyltransferase